MTRRLFFALAGLAVVVLILSDVLGRDQVVVAERRGAVISLEREAFKIALAAQDDLEHAPHPTRTGEIRARTRLIASELGAIAVVTDRTGTIVAAAPAGARGSARTLTDRESARAMARSTTGSRTVRLAGTDYEVAEVPIVANEGVVGAVLLAQQSSVLDEAAHDRLGFLTPALLIAVLLSIVVAWLLARALTRPLEQLVAATRRVARDGTTAPSVEPRGPAEVRDLAEAFNAMSLRVRELIDRQSQFASDVSHQLRTPLTTLGVAVERTRDRGGAGDIPGAGESLAAVQAEVTRLGQLVEGLLVLTKVPLADAAREPVDVADIVRERAAMWRALAAERAVEVTVATPAVAGALALVGAVDQILDNLLDNAVEVAPAGSVIALEVTTRAGVVTMAVTDSGPGLSEVERTRAFDRFWRGEGSGDSEGIGIGLTIVRDLTLASQGEIELLAAATGGIRAELRLQAAPLPDSGPTGVVGGTGTAATTARLRSRLGRYLRARDPERADAVESEVWHAFTLECTDVDGCDDCATTVFTMAHDRLPEPSSSPSDDSDGVDVHLLRTLGGLDTEQIARVLEVTPRTVTRLEKRARLPVVDGRLVPEVAPVRHLSRSARVGVIAAAAVVAATGTAAATGSLPDPVQHQVARVLRSVGVSVPDPTPTRPAGLPGSNGSDPAPASNTASPTSVRVRGALVARESGPGAPAAAAAKGRDDRPTTRTATPATEPAGGTATPPGQAKKTDAPVFVPPGQAKKADAPVFVPPGQAKKADAPVNVAPGQARKTDPGPASVPPGRAKKTDAPMSVPPGQAKKTDTPGNVAPGQAKQTEAGRASTPPGQAKKAGG